MASSLYDTYAGGSSRFRPSNRNAHRPNHMPPTAMAAPSRPAGMIGTAYHRLMVVKHPNAMKPSQEPYNMAKPLALPSVIIAPAVPVA